MALLRTHRIARVNYPIRTGAFAYSFFVLALFGVDRGFGPLFWVLLVANFLVYPHLAYLRTRLSADSKAAEIQTMFVDAALLGAWTGALHFPLWIAYAALFSTSLNAAAVRGIPAALLSAASFCAGAAVAGSATGLQFVPETSGAVTALCFFGSLAYSVALGNVMQRQNQRLLDARNELYESEERYRLLAEHAADLIALVDKDGRWLYVSPSYERLLDPADLEEGVDAFRRVHPDDADRARLAVLRAAATGKPRELPLRLVDREGRIRQFKTRVQAVNANAEQGRTPAERLVLVSHDVTDLRENEERLLLAAHALEGMTEAIVITSADGTIVTVNRAFSEITGFTREEALGAREKEVRTALQPPEFYDDVYAAVQRHGYWSGTTWARRKSGSVYREWRSVRAVKDPEGAVTHYVMVFYEVGAPSRGQEDDAVRA
jgi:PAS domain S-box-containing protein